MFSVSSNCMASPKLFSPKVWTLTGRDPETTLIQTLPQSLTHLGKKKKDTPDSVGQSQSYLPTHLPQPHHWIKRKVGVKRKLFHWKPESGHWLQLPQIAFRGLPTTQSQHKERGKYHVKTCLFLHVLKYTPCSL